MKINTKSKFVDIYKNKSIKQFTGLFSANLLGLPLGFLTSIVITKYLGPQLYGDYKFFDSIFRIAIIICNFGLFSACNRALILNDDKTKSREYYGVSLLIILILSIIMGIGLLIYAIYDPNINSKNLLEPFICILPFGFVYMMNNSMESILHADNKIRLLAYIRLFPKIGYLIGGIAALLWLSNIAFNKLLIVCYIFLITQLVVYIYVIYNLSPSFKNIKQRFKDIWQYNKSYGFDIYIGALFAVGFATLPDLLISYFGIDNKGVGFYSLALMFASPLAFIPSTIATTKYREFAKLRSIPSKLIVLTLILSFIAMFCLWIFVPIFINLFFEETFIQVIGINYIVSFGVLMHGLADFYNRFLGAKGEGRLLRNSSFAVGASIVVLNVALIPIYGAIGAAYAKVLSGFIYLVIMIYCYKLVIRKPQ